MTAAIYILAALIFAGGVYLMRKISRELNGDLRTNHGRRLPPRSPARKKRGF